MRALAIVVIIAAAGFAVPAQAQNYPWCAQYGSTGGGGGNNCGFSTYRQCRAAISGNGGMCYRNPMFRGGRSRHR